MKKEEAKHLSCFQGLRESKSERSSISARAFVCIVRVVQTHDEHVSVFAVWKFAGVTTRRAVELIEGRCKNQLCSTSIQCLSLWNLQLSVPGQDMSITDKYFLFQTFSAKEYGRTSWSLWNEK